MLPLLDMEDDDAEEINLDIDLLPVDGQMQLIALVDRIVRRQQEQDKALLAPDMPEKQSPTKTLNMSPNMDMQTSQKESKASEENGGASFQVPLATAHPKIEMDIAGFLAVEMQSSKGCGHGDLQPPHNQEQISEGTMLDKAHDIVAMVDFGWD